MAMRLGKNYSNIFICIGDVMDSMLTLSLVDSGFESRSGQVRSGDVMDSMFTFSLVDSGFESRSGQTKDY